MPVLLLGPSGALLPAPPGTGVSSRFGREMLPLLWLGVGMGFGTRIGRLEHPQLREEGLMFNI